MVCSLCNQPIERGQTRLEEVTGWVKYRGSQGGANAVSQKRPTGRVAHAVCVNKPAGMQQQDSLL